MPENKNGKTDRRAACLLLVELTAADETAKGNIGAKLDYFTHHALAKAESVGLDTPTQVEITKACIEAGYRIDDDTILF